MRRSAILFVSIVLVISAACSSRNKEIKRILESPISYEAYLSPQADFDGYATWDWLPVAAQASADPRASNAQLRKDIEQAVSAQMHVREYRKGSGRSDLAINYHVVRRDVDPEFMRQMYDGKYIPQYREDYEAPRKARYKWDEGSLVIVIFDTRTRELVWRGTAKAEIAPDAPRDMSLVRLNKAVKHMFTSFPGRPLGAARAD
jgi:hypothetical protein